MRFTIKDFREYLAPVTLYPVDKELESGIFQISDVALFRSRKRQCRLGGFHFPLIYLLSHAPDLILVGIRQVVCFHEVVLDVVERGLVAIAPRWFVGAEEFPIALADG